LKAIGQGRSSNQIAFRGCWFYKKSIFGKPNMTRRVDTVGLHITKRRNDNKLSAFMAKVNWMTRGAEFLKSRNFVAHSSLEEGY
jgi:hypothetical protein